MQVKNDNGDDNHGKRGGVGGTDQGSGYNHDQKISTTNLFIYKAIKLY